MFTKMFDNFYSYLAASLSVLFLEIALVLRLRFSLESYVFLGVVFASFAIGAAICFLSSLTKSTTANGWILFVLIELVTIFFLVEVFCYQTYNVFMDVKALKNGTAGVATEFMGVVLNIIKNGIPTILLFHIPALLILFFAIKKKINLQRTLAGSLFFVLLTVMLSLGGSAADTLDKAAEEKYTYNFTYSDAVKFFGLTHATTADIKYSYTGVPQPPEPIAVDPIPKVDDEVERNELNFDWDAIQESTNDATLHRLFSYVKNRQASSKNDYTGLFEGKNIVMFAVESMSKEMITEEFFPLMYRMMTKGIVFEDYYIPYWGGSTSTGETSILTGVMPLHNLDTIQMTIGNDNSYTLPSMLTAQRDYYTASYHNGDPNFYNRIETHPGLGFSKFDSNQSAMINYMTYFVPPSDQEMLRYVADDIEGISSFCIYMMTYSGHGNYSFDWTQNQMGAKNHELLLGSPLYDDPFIGGYISCSMELELGLEEFVERLEASGELDDTVFVFSSDHVPYFLTEPVQWGGENYLVKFFGQEYENDDAVRDHNALIIWSPCLEEMDSEPTSSIDILPTLLNLFGVEFDSRIYSGRDVFSDADALVMWPDTSWKTEKGYYNAITNEYIPADGYEADTEYIESVKATVNNKLFYARNFFKLDFYSYLTPHILEKEAPEIISEPETNSDGTSTDINTNSNTDNEKN